MFITYTTVTSAFDFNEIKLNIDVIIHKSEKIINAFTDFINEYSKFSIDQEFVELSKKN